MIKSRLEVSLVTISVIYLAHYYPEAGYGIETVETFLNSYKAHPAGMEHSLFIIAKNWTDNVEYKKLRKLAEENNARIIETPNDGFDFGSYFRVSKTIESDYILFLSSSINIRSANWLISHYNAFKCDPSVVLVGAMGSWGDTEKRIFPNYHIRTCSFMMKRELFVEYASAQKIPETKEDTYEMEHGENSLTNFVLNKGYKAVVVNSDGGIFAPEDWDISQTYRHPGEWKSVFSDKHSLYYYQINDDDKQSFERTAWGRSLKQTKVKIFVSYHTNSTLMQSEIFQPIFNGAADKPNALKILKDNSGINISEKNNHYAELTGHYWVWKNLLSKIDSEYIGFCHYRRFLDFNLTPINPVSFPTLLILEFKAMFDRYTEENIINQIGNYDIVLPNKCQLEVSRYEQYLEYHPKKDMDIALDILNELYPDYIDATKKVMGSNELHQCLTFVMKKELVQDYFEWIFNILTVLEERTDWSEYNEYHNVRTPAFIAERFFDIWVEHNIKTKNYKLLNTTSVLLDLDVNAYIAKYMAEIEKLQKG